ncbi:unnamed protein product [Rhizophagus irregularis]|nr:unnamed protein product [Rhizophagus irregularis]
MYFYDFEPATKHEEMSIKIDLFAIILLQVIIMSVFKIAGICGSLRKDSCNKKLLLRTQQLCSEHIKGATIEIIDWSQVPIYNQDLESNSPQSVLDFKNSLAVSLTMMQSYFLHQNITTVFRVH